MGKGTVISNGQGDEKVWVTEAVYDGDELMVDKDQTVETFVTAEDFEPGNGATVNISWSSGDRCIQLDSWAGGAKGKANNEGGRSTKVKIEDSMGTTYTVGDWIEISDWEYAGSNNETWADQQVICTEVKDGCGWLRADNT